LSSFVRKDSRCRYFQNLRVSRSRMGFLSIDKNRVLPLPKIPMGKKEEFVLRVKSGGDLNCFIKSFWGGFFEG